MGVDLRLSGLASGFDWKPVVEQLIELERIPQKRLAQEQEANNTKISELGILKSQLETLKSSAESLQSNDLYDARTITFGEDTSD
jgi:flagellar hook-associated protein 2